jgi:exopolysaccharide production protein ExoQ
LQDASVANAASALGRDATFTGRTEIWAGLIPEAAQNPVLGVGFGSFWTAEKEAEHRIGEAHNGYLDLRLEQGFVGVVLVMLVFITSALKALQNPARDWGCLLLCFIVIAVMHNISESSINCMASHLIGLIVFLTMTVNAQSVRVMTPRVARGTAMKQVLHA